MPKHPVKTLSKLVIYITEVNQNANCKYWDRTTGLDNIHPALYHYSHPNQKPKGTLHCAMELQWHDKDTLYQNINLISSI